MNYIECTDEESEGNVRDSLLQMTEGSKQDSKNDEDIISKSIGDFGRWQLFLTFILSLVNIPCTWHIFAPTFHARERDFWCVSTELQNISVTDWEDCESSNHCWINNTGYYNYTEVVCDRGVNVMTKCTDWNFAEIGTTIISDFNLVCDRKKLINLAEMMFLAGVAAGGLASGIISDKYGRKKTLLLSVFMQCSLGTAVAFSPCFELYAILRCCLGFFSVSVVFSGFVLAIELVSGHWRTITGISYLFPVSLGYCTIAGLAYLLRNWRHLQLAMSLPGTIFLTAWFFMPESPRWLLALGRTKEVRKILETAARCNKRELPTDLDKQLTPPKSTDQEQHTSVGVTDLFKTAKMRTKTLILFLIWFGVYLVYYGLVLNIGNIGGDIYINSILTGLVEVPAVSISIFILIKGGRRWPLALTMILSGIFAALAIPVAWISDDLQWLITMFTMTSKFCISSSNAIMPVFTAELYPTIIRNIGVGAANVPAGTALMLVPYLWELVNLHTSLPLLVIAIFGIVGGAFTLFLPETGSKPLSDTLESAESSNTSATNGDINRNNTYI